jgi:hypothetical protein
MKQRGSKEVEERRSWQQGRENKAQGTVSEPAIAAPQRGRPGRTAAMCSIAWCCPLPVLLPSHPFCACSKGDETATGWSATDHSHTDARRGRQGGRPCDGHQGRGRGMDWEQQRSERGVRAVAATTVNSGGPLRVARHRSGEAPVDLGHPSLGDPFLQFVHACEWCARCLRPALTAPWLTRNCEPELDFARAAKGTVVPPFLLLLQLQRVAATRLPCVRIPFKRWMPKCPSTHSAACQNYVAP